MNTRVLDELAPLVTCGTIRHVLNLACACSLTLMAYQETEHIEFTKACPAAEGELLSHKALGGMSNYCE
jgi:hypothetical protein